MKSIHNVCMYDICMMKVSRLAFVLVQCITGTFKEL